MSDALGSILSSHLVGVGGLVSGDVDSPVRNNTSYGLLDSMTVSVPATGAKPVLLVFSGTFICGQTGWVGVAAGLSASSIFGSTEAFRYFTVGGLSRTVSFIGWAAGSSAARTFGIYWKTSGPVEAEERRRSFITLSY